MKEIPRNQVHIFDEIVDRFVKREIQNKKVRDRPGFKNDFIAEISKLAYYIAVKKMVTTIKLNDYLNSMDEKEANFASALIEVGISGRILDYNEQTGDIRFIHNRFLEYFSSQFILTRYKLKTDVLPTNFFTNIWWRETILFLAGLEDRPSYLVNQILKYRLNINKPDLYISKLLDTELLILSNDCINVSLSFDDDAFVSRIRNELIELYYSANTLVKAKVLTALRFDTSPEAEAVFDNALKSDSLWLSERAFFILSNGLLRFKQTAFGILKEYFKYFKEGRMITNFLPILKASRKSNLAIMMMPIYTGFMLLNILALVAILFVFYSVADF